jgi:ribosome-interacting GTPase 1
MSANLTPQYHKAEKAYRNASSPQEEIACLEVMLREIPKHKGTDKLQAELKQKIARLKKDAATQKSTGKRSGFR